MAGERAWAPHQRACGYRRVDRVSGGALTHPGRQLSEPSEHGGLGHRDRPPGQVREHGELRPQPGPGEVVERALRRAHLPQRAGPGRASGPAGSRPRGDHGPSVEGGAGSRHLPFRTIFHFHEHREVHAVAEDGRLPGRKRDEEAGLALRRVHRGADRIPVIGGGKPVGDLNRGVLDGVGDEAGRNLLGDHQALTVGADLREQAGEHLDGVPGGARP